jgi:heat shock protein HslJ
MRRVTVLLALALAGCSTGADGAWVLDDFLADGEAIDVVAPVTMQVEADRVSGSSGCNTYSGSIGTDGGAVVVSGVAVTERFCEDTDVMALEARFLEVLVAERWDVEATDDALTMIARADDEPSIDLPTTLDFRSAP